MTVKETNKKKKTPEETLEACSRKKPQERIMSIFKFLRRANALNPVYLGICNHIITNTSIPDGQCLIIHAENVFGINKRIPVDSIKIESTTEITINGETFNISGIKGITFGSIAIPCPVSN